MIYESAPWKRDLLRDADLIERWVVKPCSPRRSELFEKKIFLSAFAMRKLVEARRLSTSFLNRTVRALLLPSVGRRPNRLNNHHFDRQYLLDEGVPTDLSATRLIDLVIHSYTFVESMDDDDVIQGFLIASDRTKDRGLYEIQVSDYLALMRTAGRDDPQMTVFRFNEKSGDYDVWRGPMPKGD